MATLKNVFGPGDLDLWPMSLTFKLDLHILPLDLHAENQVRMSVYSAVRVVTYNTHTHTHTHSQCQNYYTHRWRGVWWLSLCSRQYTNNASTVSFHILKNLHFRHCGIKDPSWYELMNFVSFLHEQLVDAEGCSFCSKATQDVIPDFFKFVITFMIQMSEVY